MSTTTKATKVNRTTKTKTVSQRTTDATRRLQATLGVEDLKVLSAAIAEAAASEADHNVQFRSQVRAVYDELVALQAHQSARGRTKAAAAHVELTPLPGTEGIHVDPFGSVDPYLLLRLYGPSQLRAALSGFSYSALKDAAALVKAQHPNTKPKNGRSTDSILDYIVERLAPGN